MRPGFNFRALALVLMLIGQLALLWHAPSHALAADADLDFACIYCQASSGGPQPSAPAIIHTASWSLSVDYPAVAILVSPPVADLNRSRAPPTA
jgi:hypothetical protein